MKNLSKGQTLVSLILFVSIATIIISAMVTIIGSNSILASVNQRSLLVKQAAENGVENAFLNLLRNPSYSGETIPANINGFRTEVVVTGNDSNKTIVSTASTIDYQWKIVSKINYTNNIMSVTFWQDSYE